MPGLAYAVSELTIAHAQVLLPVPMEGLRSRPAFPIGLEDAMDFPIGAIGNQDLARFAGPFLRPQHHDPHRMGKGRDADALGEIPLGQASHADLVATSRTEIGRNPVADDALLSVDADLAVGLQVAYIGPLGSMNMVENLGIGEIAIKGDVARDALGDDPINQLDTQIGVRAEGVLRGSTGL